MCKSFRTFCTIIGVYRRKVEGRSPFVIALLLFSIPHSFGDPSQPIPTTYSTTDICLRWRFCLSVLSESARVGTFCTILRVGGRGRGDGGDGGGGGLILLSLPSAGIRHVSSTFLHFTFWIYEYQTRFRGKVICPFKTKNILGLPSTIYCTHISFCSFSSFLQSCIWCTQSLSIQLSIKLDLSENSSKTFLRTIWNISPEIIWNTSTENLKHSS